MLTTFLISFLAISSLTETQFLTKDGILVETNGLPVDTDHLEFILRELIKEMSVQDRIFYTEDEIRKYLKSVKITFNRGKVACGKQELCDGVTVGNHVRVKWKRCLANSGLVHELIHLLNKKFEGIEDKEHKRTQYFKENTKTRSEAYYSVEGGVGWTIKFTLCPDNDR